MKKLKRINSGIFVFTVLIALLVTGLALGGFSRVRANGSMICLDCIGISRLGRVGTVVSYAALAVISVLFIILVLATFSSIGKRETSKLHASRSRRYAQFAAALLANPWFYYYFSRRIYSGALKGVCIPGMNCYGCPQAACSCPVGSLQHALISRSSAALMYIIGTIGAIGAFLGRMPCGWICPFGLLQELLYKIPFPKLRLPKWAGGFKYGSLAVLAVFLPLVLKSPWFTRLCPVGALQGGIPLQVFPPAGLTRTAMQPGLFFWLKIAILGLFLFWMITTRRPFCRTTCPMGALLSIFNPVSLYRMEVDEESCTKCGKCREVCPVDINIYDNPNSPECIRCLECKKACPAGSITSGFRLLKERESVVIEVEPNHILKGPTGDGQT